ncbi:phosphate acyltransferase PlsX [candidate division KSB1 bacterium]|nr:phosphate acyltransferase PlsX [candidate division KSB1 bacterium]
MVVVALDVMGGDHAPAVPIDAALAALDEFGTGLRLMLVGPAELVEKELKHRRGGIDDRIEIVHASEVVLMTDKPAKAIRTKPNSSLIKAVEMHRDGRAAAVVSAGHTGVQMAASFMLLGLIEGVKRPTIGGLFPVGKGKFSILCDVGANTDCKPINLLQFAAMGSVFMEIMTGKANPTVGLLSIGSEKNKGNEAVLAAHYLLEQSGLNFVGNVEGGDILRGNCDVYVCDGFVGNIVLKFAESVGPMVFARLAGMASPDGADSGAGSVLRQLQKDFDYAEVGGVPLLGVNGISIICHGGSSAKAVKNAIREAMTLSKGGLPQALSEGIERFDAGMLARGMARFKSFQERQDQFDVEDEQND